MLKEVEEEERKKLNNIMAKLNIMWARTHYSMALYCEAHIHVTIG